MSKKSCTFAAAKANDPKNRALLQFACKGTKNF